MSEPSPSVRFPVGSPDGPPEGLIDLAPAATDLEAEAVAGLTARRKTLPCKLFYDRRGAALFEAICEQPEYYLTRVETSILRASMGEITACIGAKAQLIEPGSGVGSKIRLLLESLDDPVSYVPIDISKAQLRQVATEVHAEHPRLAVQAVCADFSQAIQAPATRRPARRRVVFFPGSTLGNFTAAEATSFLGRMADLVGPGGGLLIGVDLVKDPDVLRAAYDDAAGVTAEFNANALRRLNEELGADFALDRFAHEAIWDTEHQRIEMHLRSTIAQVVHLGGREIRFAAGETILTELCHKYGPEGVASLTDRFRLVQTWTDPEGRFAVQFLEVPLGTSAEHFPRGERPRERDRTP